MDMNEALPAISIPIEKIDITDNADTTIFGQACRPSGRITLVAIDENSLDCSIEISAVRGNLIRICRLKEPNSTVLIVLNQGLQKLPIPASTV